MKENRYLEFKEKISKSFLKTVSAFSNFSTGQIIFGIDDSGNVCGLDDLSENCLAIENMINDSIVPKPDFSIETAGNTIVLTVREGKYKPYFYNGKAYRRSDTASIEVDHSELKKLVLEGNNINFEELNCTDQNLSFLYLENVLKERLSLSALSKDNLITLGLINRDMKHNNAASLFADSNSFSGIDIARFGDSISIILDRETLNNISILEQYDKAISIFKRYYCYEKIEGFNRESIELIPEIAFREAIANSLVHRTWDSSANITVYMFKDRIEISSPGGLPSGIGENEYLNGNVSILRNPIIGNIFFRLGYIEKFGTGVRRIMETYSSSTRKPEFIISDNSIKVILPLISDTYNTNSDEQKVVELLQNNNELTSREIAESLHFSKDKSIRILNSLVSKKYIKKSGNNKSTRYYLI